MATERKTELKLTEAAAKTTAVLQTLQSRLKRDTAPPEAPDELGAAWKDGKLHLPLKATINGNIGDHRVARCTAQPRLASPRRSGKSGLSISGAAVTGHDCWPGVATDPSGGMV